MNSLVCTFALVLVQVADARITVRMDLPSPSILQSFSSTLMVSASHSRGFTPDTNETIDYDARLNRFNLPISFGWSVDPMSPGTHVSIAADTVSAVITFGQPGIYNIYCVSNGSTAVVDVADQLQQSAAYAQVGYVGVQDDLSCLTSAGGSGTVSVDEAEKILTFVAEALSESKDLVDSLTYSNFAVPRPVDLLLKLDQEYILGSRSDILGGLASRMLMEFNEHNELISGIMVSDLDGLTIAADPLPFDLWQGDEDKVILANNSVHISTIEYEYDETGSLVIQISKRVNIGGQGAYITVDVNMTTMVGLARWLPEHGRLARPLMNLPIPLVRKLSAWKPIMRKLAPLLGEWTGGTRVARAFTAMVTPTQAAALGFGQIEAAAEHLALQKAYEFRRTTFRDRWQTLSGTDGPARATIASFYLDPGCDRSYTGFCLVEQVSLGMSPTELAAATTAHQTLGWLVRLWAKEDVVEETSVLQPDKQCPTCGFGVVWHIHTPVTVEIGGSGYVLRDATHESFEALSRRVGASVHAEGFDSSRRSSYVAAVAAAAKSGVMEFTLDGDLVLSGPDVAPSVAAREREATIAQLFVPTDPVALAEETYDGAVARHRAAEAAATYVTSSLPTPDAVYALPHAMFNLSMLHLRFLHCPNPVTVAVQFIEDMRVPSLVVEPGFEVPLTPRDSSERVFVPAECVGSACAYAIYTPAAAVASYLGRTDIKGNARAQIAREALGGGVAAGGNLSMSIVRLSRRAGAHVGDGYDWDKDGFDGDDGLHGVNSTKRATALDMYSVTPTHTIDEYGYGFVSRARESFFSPYEDIDIVEPELVFPPSESGFVHTVMMQITSYIVSFKDVGQVLVQRVAEAEVRTQTDLDRILTNFSRKRTLGPNLVSGFLRSILEGAVVQLFDGVAIYDKGGLIVGAYPAASSTLPLYLNEELRTTASGGLTVQRATRQRVSRSAEGIRNAVRIQMVLRFDFVNNTMKYSRTKAPLDTAAGYITFAFVTSVLELHTYVDTRGRLLTFAPGTPMRLPVGSYEFTHDYIIGTTHKLRGRHTFRVGVVDCGRGELRSDGTCLASEMSLYVTVGIVGAIVLIVLVALVFVVLRMYYRYLVQRAKYDQLPRPRTVSDIHSDEEDDDDHAGHAHSHGGQAPRKEKSEKEKERRREVVLHPGTVVPAPAVIEHGCYAMFTDIEGSTQLWQQFAALMEEAVQEHHRVIRARCAKNHGVEVNSQGDSFFFVFHTAAGCVETCVMIQLDLLTAKWRSRLLRIPLLMMSGEADADVSTEGGKRENARLSSVARSRKTGTIGSDSPRRGGGATSDVASNHNPSSAAGAPHGASGNIRSLQAIVMQAKVSVDECPVRASHVDTTSPTTTAASFQSLLPLTTSPLAARGAANAPSYAALAQSGKTSTDGAPTHPTHLPFADGATAAGGLSGTLSNSSFDSGWPRGGAPRAHQPAGQGPQQTTGVSPASTGLITRQPITSPLTSPPQSPGYPPVPLAGPLTGPSVLSNATSASNFVVPGARAAGGNDGERSSNVPPPKADSRQRAHNIIGHMPVKSTLPHAEQTLVDYTTPSISWRGLRVRVGASPLSNARLHLFGLQSFREYLASCGSAQKGSALAFDYVGPDVNRAARVAGAARGGEVVMPATMMDQLPREMVPLLSVVAMGGVFLKGIGNSGELVSILPKGLVRTFNTQASATHCEKCYGLLSCVACDHDEGRLGEWMGAVE